MHGKTANWLQALQNQGLAARVLSFSQSYPQ
jgi:hypothetical protein